MKKYLSLSLFAVVCALFLSTLYHAGSFSILQPHTSLTDIKIYNQAAGTEDLEIINTKGILLISSSDRWKTDTSQDGIYALDLKDNNATPQLLKSNFEGDFHPHGISYLRKNGKDYLFAVNHNSKGDYIELFQIKGHTLEHIKSFEDEKMCCPNDVVAIDLDKFYVTNDHESPNGFGRTMEDYLRIAKSYVLYYDGNSYAKVFNNLNYANGINISNDGKTLYVTETTGRRITVLDRDTTTGYLKIRFTKKLHSGVDNITIDIDDNLWIGSHPKLLAFTQHAKDKKNHSPSQVLKLTHRGEKEFKNEDFYVTEIYLNNGEELSGSSTALYYEGKVYVGVVFESKLLRGGYP